MITIIIDKSKATEEEIENLNNILPNGNQQYLSDKCNVKFINFDKDDIEKANSNGTTIESGLMENVILGNVDRKEIDKELLKDFLPEEKDEYFQCSYVKKCKWIGKEKDTVNKKNDKYKNLNVLEMTCPRCGNDSFYVLSKEEYEKIQSKKIKINYKKGNSYVRNKKYIF